MRIEVFRNWLQGKISSRSVSDCISRCRRIEKSLGLDLDDEYKKDGGRNLVKLLKYTAEDERINRPAPMAIHFAPGSNIRNGMSSLRSAINKYFEFCRSSM